MQLSGVVVQHMPDLGGPVYASLRSRRRCSRDDCGTVNQRAGRTNRRFNDTRLKVLSELAPSTSTRNYLQPANSRHVWVTLMVKRRHKPIFDSEISSRNYHPASQKGGLKTPPTIALPRTVLFSKDIGRDSIARWGIPPGALTRLTLTSTGLLFAEKTTCGFTAVANR
jgi:hypothetical protein